MLAMERRFADMAKHYRFPDYGGFGRIRAGLLDYGTPSPPTRQLEHAGGLHGSGGVRQVEIADSRHVWSTIFAHLLAGCSGATTAEVMNDITYSCATYAGESFAVFACMLLTLQLVIGFLPAPVVVCLCHYVDTLDQSNQGQVPKTFICHPRQEPQ
jgi:hypothetical protein